MRSLDNAASPWIHRDEAVKAALLLAFAGGCLDADTAAASLQQCASRLGYLSAPAQPKASRISRFSYPWSHC
jgi:hypothetical protein